jgi:hypothetical protein
MDDIDIIDWQEGTGDSVEIGYLNPNGQQCFGHCGVRGTDHEQYAYKTECTYCGYVYGTNGSDMHGKKVQVSGGIKFLGFHLHIWN